MNCVEIGNQSVSILGIGTREKMSKGNLALKTADGAIFHLTQAQLQEALSSYIASNRARRSKFTFTSGGTLYSVPVDQICCFQSEGRRVILYTLESSYSFYAKLNDVAETPVLSEFIRCHQSYLLNPDFVERISAKLVSLSGGMELAISKGNYENVKSSYLRYLSKIGQ